MRSSRTIFTFLISLILLMPLSGEEFVENQLLVKFTKSAQIELVKNNFVPGAISGLNAVDQLNNEFGLTKVRKLYRFPIKNKALDEKYGLSRTYVLEFADAINISAAVQSYENLSAIEVAEGNGIYNAIFNRLNGQKMAPNDPIYPYQWAHDNTGQAISYSGTLVGTPDADTDTPEAWDISQGSASVLLAIIDSGVDYTHPEFEGRMEPGYDFINDDNDPMDDNGHGTSCAGIASAMGNNGFGVAGVSWYSRILPVKVLSAGGSGSWEAVANGITFAADAGAQVLSLSLGGGSSTLVEDAVNYAYDLDCIILSASGNDNSGEAFYPASYTNSVSVGAMSPCNERKSPSSCDGETWWGSNYGNGLNFVTPGTRIHTTDITGSGGYDSGDYMTHFNGTSSACPHAAGIAALIRAVNPALTNAQVLALMEETADDIEDLGYDDFTGYGRLNAHAALSQIAGGFFVSADSIGFGDVEVNSSDTLSFSIINNTQTPVNVDFSVTGTVFSLSTASVIIDTMSFTAIDVDFTPTSDAFYSEVLTITTVDTTVDVELTGQGVFYPNIFTTPESISLTLDQGDIDSVELTIGNDGDAELDWNIGGAAKNRYPASYYTSNLQKGEDDPRRGQVNLLGSGGPDAFGYRWIDSDENPSLYNWIDISSTGTLIDGFTDDNSVGPFPLGFSFPFYSNNYSEFFVGSNGLIGFVDEGLDEYDNDPIPAEHSPNTMIAWFWDDLYPQGQVYYETIDGACIIQFQEYGEYPSSSAERVTAQVIIYANGQIKVQYQTFTANFDTDEATIGIENGDGTIGLEANFNASYVHDEMAILFAKGFEMSFNPTSGSLDPGLDEIVSVQISAGDSEPGVYSDYIRINSNDPDQPVLSVPIEVTVLGAANIVVDPSALDFGKVNLGDSAFVELAISNTGYNVLNITNIESDTSIFGFNSDSAFDVGIGETVVVPMFFAPTDTGMSSGNLTIENNDETIVVALSGKAGFYPQTVLTPSALVYEMDEGQSDTAMLTISNSGDGDLLWSINPEMQHDTLGFAISGSPDMGTVAPDSSVEVAIIINSALVDAGSYETVISLLTNEPYNEVIDHPVSINVIGAPVLTLSPDSLDFGLVGNGESLTREVNVINTGSAALEVLSVAVTEGNFAVADTGFVLEPDEVLPLSVTFSPDSVGSFTGTLTVTIADTFKQVILSGTGALFPELWMASDSMHVIVGNGDSTTTTFSLWNNGEADLHWYIQMEESKVSYPDHYYREIAKGVVDERIGEINISNSGGPDNFGYMWYDSEDNSALYDWIDISGTGTVVTGLTDDNYVGPFDIGFEFPFYENSYSEFYIGSNGLIGFNTDYMNAITNYPIPTLSTPNDIIAWFWDDLYPDGTVYYEQFANYTIVQFQDYGEYSFSGTDYRITAQVILYNNGSIKIQYQSIDEGFDLLSSTIGIENIDGTDGLEVNFNAEYVQDNLAIMISAGDNMDMTFDMMSGIIAPGEEGQVALTVKAMDDAFGAHTAHFWLMSNDPDDSAHLMTVLVDIVTSVNESSVLPQQYFLSQNYPNPFNPTTTIAYGIPVNGKLKIELYNVLGQKVRTLFDGNQNAGSYKLNVNIENLSSGAYFYRMEAGSFVQIRKMLILK